MKRSGLITRLKDCKIIPTKPRQDYPTSKIIRLNNNLSIFQFCNFVILISVLFDVKAFAHEPIYGHGPHVLYKGGFALGFVFSSGTGFIENEFELEYGLTSKWTIGTALPFSNAAGSYSAENYVIKSKYRFYIEYAPGSMNEIAAFGGYRFSKETNGINAFNFGITGGRESIDWYWFASVGYITKFTKIDPKPGNEINYDLTFGYRPFEISYYKPDLVIFLEFLGKYQQKSSLNDNNINNSGGNSWAIAPTFMLTYRNYALRAGVEFGIGDSGFIKKAETNFKIGIETHL